MDDLLLLAAIVSAVVGAWSLKQYYAGPPLAVGPVAGTETWTVEEVDALRLGSVEVSGPGEFRRLVSVVATARPGPGGPLRTREDGVECVWWRSETTRHHVELVDGERVARSERVGHNWSREPFTLADPTGTITVWPDGAEVTGAKAVHRVDEQVTPEAAESVWSKLTDKDTTTAVVTVEYAVRAGERVFVHGEAHDRLDGLTIAKSPSGAPFHISTKPEHVLRERAEKADRAVASLRLRGYGLIGLAVVFMILFYVV
ncbi:GIDE domain-containing protein [Labedaea rhizosphaerae]|uniref:RING-type E3 ubiquitin transferase n=1 Tax=Labedaea rhizosphaerae TaxID=598644 RepID=A0A4R6SBS7_LABRH|nr:GIDE domain-containing protein [Labedaea rhizosphaerae]TDP96345.1 E3 ubiquitin ligase [Labedaea rhizosphaerae]